MSRHSHRAAAPVGLVPPSPGCSGAHGPADRRRLVQCANPPILGGILLACLCTLKGSDRLRASLPYFRVGLYAGLTILVINPIFSTGVSTPVRNGPGALPPPSHLGGHSLRSRTGTAFGHGLSWLLPPRRWCWIRITSSPFAELAVHRSALVVSLATRLLPVLSRDAARISDAQRSREQNWTAGAGETAPPPAASPRRTPLRRAWSAPRMWLPPWRPAGSGGPVAPAGAGTCAGNRPTTPSSPPPLPPFCS